SVLAITVSPAVALARRLESADYLKLRAVTGVQLSPDVARVAYTVQLNDGPGRPRTQLWVAGLPDGKGSRVGAEGDSGSDPAWSPDGRWIAYSGSAAGREGLMVVSADGGTPRWLAEMRGTNSPLTFEGRTIAWSPDSRRIA